MPDLEVWIIDIHIKQMLWNLFKINPPRRLWDEPPIAKLYGPLLAKLLINSRDFIDFDTMHKNAYKDLLEV